MIKKCIASLLAAVMLFSIGSTCVFAEKTTFTDEQLIYWLLQMDGSSLTEEEVSSSCKAVGQSKGATVYYCGYRESTPASKTSGYAAEKLGNYLFMNEPCFLEDAMRNCDVYTLGIYVVSGQEAMPLDTAYHEGLVDIDEVAAMAFPDEFLCIKKTDAKLNNAEKLILRYIDDCDYSDSMCPLFSAGQLGEVNGYAVCEFWLWIIPPMDGYHPFFCGDYLVYGSDFFPNRSGLYAIKGDEILTIDEAYDSGIFSTLDEVMEMAWFYDSKYKAGDFDGDKKISVSDVLALQKYLAGMIASPLLGPAPELIFDFTRDYEVNLKDAIAMQKRVALIS